MCFFHCIWSSYERNNSLPPFCPKSIALTILLYDFFKYCKPILLFRCLSVSTRVFLKRREHYIKGLLCVLVAKQIWILSKFEIVIKGFFFKSLTYVHLFIAIIKMEYVKIERCYSSLEKRMNFRSLAVWKRFETTTFGFELFSLSF